MRNHAWSFSKNPLINCKLDIYLEVAKEYIKKDLKVNGYTSVFIENVSKARAEVPKKQNELTGYTCIPYIKSLSERIKRILTDANVRTAYKPVMILADIFKIDLVMTG